MFLRIIITMSKSKSKKNDGEEGIYYEYFQQTKNFINQFGEKTILLMQVGAFFEIYGLKDSDGNVSESIIEEISDICQLNITDKKAIFNNRLVMMSGFRDFSLDKYLQILTDAGYTVPVIIQEKNGNEIIRKLNQVYSPGTYLSCDTDSLKKITNNIMCIWIDTFKPLHNLNRDFIVYGVSVINIFTGKSYMFQYETPFFMNNSTFDELERYVSIYSPSEVLFISPFEKKEIDSIIQFSGIQTQMIHFVSNGCEKVKRCTSQKYIKQLLSKFFGEEAYDICKEFQINNMATQSLCFLLNFIQEHNQNLIRKICIPDFNNTSTRMVLANHTLSQLNIIHDSNSESNSGQYSSVLSFLNKCCSSIGKRRFQYQLLNPNFDEAWLSKEYSMITNLIGEKYYFIEVFRKQLSNIKDIEKIYRQLIVKKVYPSSIAHLFKSVQNILQINICLFENPEISNYLCNEFSTDFSYEYIKSTCVSIIDFLNANLIIDSCKGISSMSSFEVNIIRSGVSIELDEIILKYDKNQEKFDEIRCYLNNLIRIQENNQDTDYIKIHETEKSGNCLQITNKRSTLLKKAIETATLNKSENAKKYSLHELKFTKASSATMQITFPILDEICKNLLILKDKINILIGKTYLEILTKIEENFYHDLENLATYVSKADVLQSKVYVAKQYNYCCPQIDSQAKKAYIDANDLRHPLIEHIQQNEIYVTNDICLGKTDSSDGILLFGINAVGKTSFIRALGISTIMAQSGMFVPCSRFVYKPYTAIFSRILGNDNLFKGLSTFAVEMSELRIILKMSDENSLILGDELCSGTENESALSIFTAGLIKLTEKKSSYVFATHFHEIVNYDEIKSLSKLVLKHMTVVFDRENDCLIYDRKLKDGSGPKTYGLEVCKSFYFDTDFIDLAYSIRDRYYLETRGELSNPSSVYNIEKLRGKCEICFEKMGEETHHLNPQKNADSNGFIGSFHKNHKANLASVCKSCHDKIHSSEKKIAVRKKTTKGFVFQGQLP